MEKLMEKFNVWLNGVLSRHKFDSEALYFNIYERVGSGEYSIELCAFSEYDPYDADWYYNDKIYSSTDENNDFAFTADKDWQKCLNSIECCINSYLNEGKYSSVLKRNKYILYGFADGDLSVAYTSEEE